MFLLFKWSVLNVVDDLQKLEKVQLGLREDQKTCNVLRERYAASVADQRRQFTLSKSFQVIDYLIEQKRVVLVFFINVSSFIFNHDETKLLKCIWRLAP